MANTGYTDFQHADIDVVSAPVYGRNFVRIMAMMAVPQDGNIFDVFPHNGIKPLMYNKYENVGSCLGHINPLISAIDEGEGVLYVAIIGISTLSAIEEGAEIGIYVGGRAIIGEYQKVEYGGKLHDSIMLAFDADTCDVYRNLLEIGAPAHNIPVWILRQYEPPAQAEFSTTTQEGMTTSAPADKAMIMDYEVDWSGGMSMQPVPASEMRPFSESETVSRQYLTMDEQCQWRKLCNATGITLNMDTANHKANLTMTTGIATAGKTSMAEPQYWLMDFDNGVYLRVYLNIHEIKYKMLGRYHLNVGQGHNNLYFRDPSVYGDIEMHPAATTSAGEEYWDAIFTITTPPGAALWADFWERLEAVAGADVEFIGGLRITDERYPCTLEYVTDTWAIKFDAPEGMTADIGVWGDVEITGMRVTKTVTTSLPYADAEYVIVTFGEGDDELLNKLDAYSVTFWGLTQTLRWSTEDLQWIMDTTEVGSPSIVITSRIMSMDSIEFSAEAGSNNIFQVDNTIYPEALYYFRMKCTWRDLICRAAGTEAWVKEADIYVADGGDRLPTRYGIYALSNYDADEYGNQSRMPEYDAAGSTRYCGIYGRNYLCRPADIYPCGLSLYPHGTEFCTYYPPYVPQVLLTRANTGTDNAIGYALSANTITFDLSSQTLGNTREAEAYAYCDLQFHPEGSSLRISFKQPGYAGNGYTIEIITTSKAITGTVVINQPVDGTLNIFIPEYEPGTETNLLDLYNAITARTTVDYKVTAVLTGDGDGVHDDITEGMTLILGGGGDEMVISNDPTEREIDDVYMHPGFMLNTSRRRSPINRVGIHAVYLSGNYSYANSSVDVMAVDTGQGLDLYALLYTGENRDRYVLAEDIWPDTEEYVDASLIESYATCMLPTEGTAAELRAIALGWQGNKITFVITQVTDDEWQAAGWKDEAKFRYDENTGAGRGTLYVRLDETGAPMGVLAPADLKTLMTASVLMTVHYTTADYVGLDDKTLYLAGGGGVAAGKYLYIHKNGHIVGLEADAVPGTFKTDNGYSDEDRYLFAGEEVDLLVYKLQNTLLGEISKESQHTDPGEETMWDIPNAGDYAAICAMIDERVAMDMINYIDINGREIAISAITYADDAYTITTDEAGNSAIASALLTRGALPCSINDIYYAPLQQRDSITKDMIYYGEYMPKITVQIPDIGVGARPWCPIISSGWFIERS